MISKPFAFVLSLFLTFNNTRLLVLITKVQNTLHLKLYTQTPQPK